MPPEPPLEQPDGFEELTLDQLSRSFARLFGGELPPEEPAEVELADEGDAADPNATLAFPQPSELAEEPYEITPRRLLEAMLFVGSPDSQPLYAERAASLMRGVETDEVHQLVKDLNDQYAADRCPYRIASEGSGYRLVLREQFQGLRDKFHGRVRQARLSQAAIDVLAIVAYNQPLTGDEVGRLRNHASGAMLSQLVRRRLLRIERDEAQPRQPRYFTTDRFLDLFGLSSLEDLPQSHDLE